MRTCELPLKAVICAAFFLVLIETASALPSGPPQQPAQPSLKQKLAPLADVVAAAIRGGKTPGAVVLVGQEGRIVYRRAFGYRSLVPVKSPMTEDTVFDLASLTKPIATATAVMQLAEAGKLDIDAPACRYWPSFTSKGKRKITLRHLLTHYSGLAPDLKTRPAWKGYKTAMRKILAERPLYPPGSRFIYSDINFEVLGEIVRRVSGLPLNVYCDRHIFQPLGMKDTRFNPLPDHKDRIAPTTFVDNRMRQGTAHDPSCYNMGGVAGHAGLFSTADDLALFSEALLNGGELKGARILKEQTVQMMTSPQQVQGMKPRGFGWDIEPPLGSPEGSEVPAAALYGHLGYTGTALWIDPSRKIYIIVLTNRVHPYGRGDVKELRAEIKELVSHALGPSQSRAVGADSPAADNPGVLTGIDVLEADGFSMLSGKRIGLITNQTGLDARGRRTIDLLHQAPEVELAAVFSPEHGLSGKENNEVPSGREPSTGLPLYSLYGDVLRPTDSMLDGLDALVFDIQDAGTRFFTYISTMGYAMEAAASKGIAFYVLDRPNPINAMIVQGPVMDEGLKSFTGYFPLPVRHGMTVGELAGMFNVEGRIGARLHVIPMRGYNRSAWYDGTGLPWVSPSPNLRSLTAEILYPGVALVEGAKVSVGRGTDTPFEVLGAPWMDGRRLADFLNGSGIAGVRFAPARFTPGSDIYKGKTCRGVKITITDRESLDAASLGIGLVRALHRLYPRSFDIGKTLPLVGSREVVDAIRRGTELHSLTSLWKPSLDRFRAQRSKYLLY